ncbi:MAG: methyltransferase [Candidatus Aenigmarchaeota archaeon]|nr:methyltransferase [Candidatus Aenigmarchaeota archaeon]
MRFGALEILTNDEVYEPRGDSFLLAEFLEGMKDLGDVLDMGTGSGIQALVASKNAKNVLGVDVNPEAVKLARKNAKINGIRNASFVVSDLFENVKEKFDLIIFNPPYLPVDDKIKGAEQWSCGKNLEIIKRFARDAKNHLKENGNILMVISSITGLKGVKKIFEEFEFKVEAVGKKKIPWETLYILEIKIKS